ncbi:gliding motility lipoprotein GldH [Chryseobacterium sp. A301]
MRKFNAIFLLLFVSVLGSCVNPKEDIQIHSLNGIWPASETQRFHFEIKEAQNPKNIIFVVRNNSEYPYQDLNLKVVARVDSTKVILTERVNLQLAESNGEWTGKGFGDTKEVLFTYKSHYRFPQNGLYTLEVSPETVREALDGIEDFGIKIQTAQLKDGK